MSKNVKFGNIANDVTLSLKVETPSKAKAGDVVPIGSDGLMGYLVTAPGEGVSNAEGYASVRLLPAQIVVELEATGSFVDGTPVYYKEVSNEATYTDDHETNSNPLVGYAVVPQGQTVGTGKVFVYLGKH